MKRVLIALTFLTPISVFGQTELGVFSATGRGAATPYVTDYQALGINPANLDLPSPFEGKTVSFGFFEGATSVYSDFFTKSQVRGMLLREEFAQLNQDERRDYASTFAGQTTRLDLDLITSGVSVNLGNVGTFAFSTRERVDMSTRLGPDLSELLFLGYASTYFSELVLTTGDTITNSGNLSADTLQLIDKGIIAPEDALAFSQMLDGTSVGFSWVREFNFGYGKRLFKNDRLEIHAGIGAKLLLGNAWMQVDVEGANVDVFSALSPVFKIDYSQIEGQNPSAFDANSPDLKPVGIGWGIDLGTTIVLQEKFLLSAAVNDIGRMTWDGNLYELNDQLFTEFSDDGANTADIVDEIIQFASPESILEWKGATSRTTKLPTTARIGLGLQVHEKLRIAADAVMPVNETVINYDKPIVALGADFRPLRWVQLSAGMVQGNEEILKLPVGLSFFVADGTWEFGFASRDLVTWFTQEDPTASLSWGFLRFRV